MQQNKLLPDAQIIVIPACHTKKEISLIDFIKNNI